MTLGYKKRWNKEQEFATIACFGQNSKKNAGISGATRNFVL